MFVISLQSARVSALRKDASVKIAVVSMPVVIAAISEVNWLARVDRYLCTSAIVSAVVVLIAKIDLFKKASRFVSIWQFSSNLLWFLFLIFRLFLQLSLTIFKTVSRGWGVRAEQKIARGTFVAEYLGELMTSAEAVSRHSVNFSYLFDLKPFRDRPIENTVDAAVYGNVSRFFNHSVRFI